MGFLPENSSKNKKRRKFLSAGYLFFICKKNLKGFSDVFVGDASGFKMHHFKSPVHNHSKAENGNNRSDSDSCAHCPGNCKNDCAYNIVDRSDGNFSAAFPHRNGKSVPRSAAEPCNHIHILADTEDKKAYHKNHEFCKKGIHFRNGIKHREKVASQSDADGIDKRSRSDRFFKQKVDKNYRKADCYACRSVCYGKNNRKSLIKRIPGGKTDIRFDLKIYSETDKEHCKSRPEHFYNSAVSR